MFSLLFEFDFLRLAVIAGVLTAVVAGVVGTWIYVNRLIFLSGGIAHSSYGGVGLAVLLGFSPLLGILGFAVATALCIAFFTYKNRSFNEPVIGISWAAGMALGVILIDVSPGYKPDVVGYLFGSIMAVSLSDLRIMFFIAVPVLLFCFLFYRPLLAFSYDEDYAATRGVQTRILYILLLLTTSVTVVMLIRVVGLILSMALFSIAPLILVRHCSSPRLLMVAASLLNIGFVLVGLMLSCWFNLTSGPAIILVATTGFLIHYSARKLLSRSSS